MIIVILITMNGVIITYNVKDSAKITKLNNFLFGKVTKVVRGNTTHYYYYKGLLDNVKYFRLSSGCYFINIVDTSMFLGTSVHILPTNGLTLKKEELTTARQYFADKYSDVKVNNL